MSESNSITFEQFVFSLGTAAFVGLGDIESPLTKKKEPNLLAAKHNIDLLELLLVKTKGNLLEQEHKLLEDILYQARIRYVSESQKKT